MLKRSRQREAIQQCLAGRFDHPTAETIYISIKDDFPTISLGTVYRNLSLLAELGEIRKLSTGVGPDRFDAVTAPHYHFTCRRCGGVMDLDIAPSEELIATASASFPGKIEEHTVQFYGICAECLQNTIN